MSIAFVVIVIDVDGDAIVYFKIDLRRGSDDFSQINASKLLKTVQCAIFSFFFLVRA